MKSRDPAMPIPGLFDCGDRGCQSNKSHNEFNELLGLMYQYVAIRQHHSLGCSSVDGMLISREERNRAHSASRPRSLWAKLVLMLTNSLREASRIDREQAAEQLAAITQKSTCRGNDCSGRNPQFRQPDKL